MRSLSQFSAVKRVLVETLPLFKRFLGNCLVFLSLPGEHLRLPLDACSLAKRLDHVGRVVQQVIGVNDTDLNASAVSIRGVVGFIFLVCKLGADLAFAAQVVEKAAELFIASLVRTEVVETSHLVQRWDSAAVVAGNAVLRMADKEGEVVGCEKISRNDSGIVWLSLRVVRIQRGVRLGASLDGRKLSGVCSNATAVVGQRWRNSRGLRIRWYPILCHIFNKGTFSLIFVSS
jgi:hypothetical protein